MRAEDDDDGDGVGVGTRSTVKRACWTSVSMEMVGLGAAIFSFCAKVLLDDFSKLSSK